MTNAPEYGERRAPQYGEYASPEEQRARTQQPPEIVPPAAQAPVPEPQPTQAAPLRGARLFDRFATYALLGYGLFTVLGSIPAAADYTSFVDTYLDMFGVDVALSDPAGARAWGLAAALVLGIGWVVTFALTWLNLRRRRVSFWIPLVAGVVINLVASMLLIAPVLNDPELWAAFQQALTGTSD